MGSCLTSCLTSSRRPLSAPIFVIELIAFKTFLAVSDGCRAAFSSLPPSSRFLFLLVLASECLVIVCFVYKRRRSGPLSALTKIETSQSLQRSPTLEAIFQIPSPPGLESSHRLEKQAMVLFRCLVLYCQDNGTDRSRCVSNTNWEGAGMRVIFWSQRVEILSFE